MDLPHEIVALILRYARLQCINSTDYTNLLLVSKKVKPEEDGIVEELSVMSTITSTPTMYGPYLPGNIKHGFFCENVCVMVTTVHARLGYYNRGRRCGVWRRIEVPNVLGICCPNLLRSCNDDKWVATKTTYKDGRKHGDEVYYDVRTKQIEGKHIYVNGHMVRAFFYIGGHVSKVYNYNNGNRDGRCFYYHTNGRIRKKGMYRNDTKSGTWIRYNKKGRVESRKHYQ